MKPAEITRAFVVGCLTVHVLGCTWVPVTDGGRGVRVLTMSAAADCEKLRTINAQTADRVWIFARTERKVREELLALAQNEAALTDGNAIAATSPREDGRQSFEIYRCPSR